VNVVDSSGPSSTLTVTNAGTVTRSGKGLALVNGSTVSLVDTTGLTADQASLGAASLRISQAVNQQLNAGASAPRPIKVASSQLTPGMLHQEEGPSAWGHVFGGSTQRDASGAALGYKDTGYGLIGGYEQTLSTHRVGFFGGVSHADANTDTASVKTDSDSVFLGVYGQYADGDWLVNASLAAGYVSYDSKRLVFDNLSCDQTARSDYNSTYLSPSFAVIRIFDMGAGFSLRPSVQLNYTYGWFSSYNENGTTRSNLSVGRRNASVLNSRVQVAARQALDNDQGAFEIRLGASQSNYGDDKVKLSLQGGAATSYGITGTNSVSGGYAGIGGRIALKNQLSVVGDIEYTQGSGDNRATLAYLGMEYRF
jgi:outer membrane autotransporter protein